MVLLCQDIFLWINFYYWCIIFWLKPDDRNLPKQVSYSITIELCFPFVELQLDKWCWKLSLSNSGLSEVEGWGEQDTYSIQTGLTTPACFQVIA